MRLGEYNGIQLALLARELHPNIKVVVFSGFDDPVLREEAERVGAPFLVKPVSSEILDQPATRQRSALSGRRDLGSFLSRSLPVS